MTFDDDLERRLRDALTRSRPDDRLDTETFLAGVHRGARRRRVRRAGAVTTLGVAAVAGIGLTVYVGSLSEPTPNSVASDHSAPAFDAGTSAPSPITTYPSPSQKSQQRVTSPTPTSVQISGGESVSASEVTALSVTATGTARQWVLAKTPGDTCAKDACASVLSTDDHGQKGSWTDLGKLPAPSATVDEPTPTSVSQLRMALRDDGSGVYDAWAFGNALWSSHDSGKTWSSVDSPAGNVDHLEAWGDTVYATATGATPGDDTTTLYRSSVSADDWTPVEVARRGLGHVSALTTGRGIVALIEDGTGLHSRLYVSTDGTVWHREKACPAGTEAQSLSTAGDSVGSSLWVGCAGLSSTVLRYADTSDLSVWNDVLDDSFPRTSTFAAQSGTSAYVADPNAQTIERVSPTAPPTPVDNVPAFGSPVFFGFTNDRYGYLLDSEGLILGTTDGGATWSPYEVAGN